MNYIFDSDALTALKNERDKFVMAAFFKTLEKPQLKISVLTAYEYEFGIANFSNDSERQKERAIYNRLLKSFTLVSLGLEDAQIYGHLKKAFLDNTGIPKNALKRHTVDLALASVAIAHDFTVVSRDKIYKDHLQPIDSRLKVVKWDS